MRELDTQLIIAKEIELLNLDQTIKFPSYSTFWVRDVTFQEDFPPRRGGNAPVNWSILHNFFITTARKLGFRTIPQAQRALSNQLHKVFSFFV